MAREPAFDALRESADFHRVIYESSSDAIMLLDQSGFFDCNGATLRMFGFESRADFVKAHPADLSPPHQPDGTDSLAAANERIETAFREGSNRFRWMHRRGSGEDFPAEVWLTAFELDGRPVLQATVRDITARVRAEQEIRRLNETLEERVHAQTRELAETNRALEDDIAARRRTEHELQLQKAYFKQLFDNSPEGIVILDREDRVVDANRAFQTMFQYPLAELHGRPLAELIIPAGLSAEGSKLSALALENQVVEADLVRQRRDGTRLDVSILGAPIMISDNRVGVFGLYRDVSRQKRTEEALAREKELAQVTLRAINDAVIRCDARLRVRFMNPAAERLTGWSESAALKRPLQEVFQPLDEHSAEPVDNAGALALGREEPVNDGPAALLRSRTGEEFAIEQAASPVRRESGKLAGVVVVFRDVSEGRRAAQQMAWQATHDALTGLYNRHEFEHRLRRLLAQHSEPARQHAMLYLDLDQFKIVNDTCGHQAGDELLRQLTGLLAAETRDADTLARLGGDEFGVILTDCPLRDARRVAEKLIGVIQDFRFVWRERQFSLGASVGVVAVDSTQSLAGLMSAADSACYAAKEKGRNRVRVYHPEDRDLAQRHDEMTWVSRLNAALEDDRFVLYCQRIDPLGRGARGPGVCWELLLRMRDEEGRIVMPGSFIAAAERYGVMPAVDRWVIRRVFNALADRHKRGTGHPADMFCINVSGTTLSEEDFVAFVTGCFREYGVNPASICFEITETAAIANLSEASEFIDQVRALGASISLDDFGAGLSSFTYLKTLHADRLKIDGAFVKDMARDPVDCAMVETIHRVGRIMGIETVAEYVESSDILAHLRRIGVDYAQGYAIHRPEPWWGDPDNRDPEVASEAGD